MLKESYKSSKEFSMGISLSLYDMKVVKKSHISEYRGLHWKPNLSSGLNHTTSHIQALIELQLGNILPKSWHNKHTQNTEGTILRSLMETAP